MGQNYIAKPPLFIGKKSGGGWKKQTRRIFSGFWRIVWQTFVPFNPQPEPPDALPPPSVQIDEEQVAQCQWIFDQAEARGNQLEQKAQWTFALLLFLAPLVISVVVFLFREEAPSSISKRIAILLLGASVIFMIMAFISIMRAISVQARQTLFLGSVVNLDTGTFKRYDRSYHAQGLLYCASVNTAMNDHLAQFVKGAHMLTIVSVVTLLAATLPASMGYSSSLRAPTKSEIVGQVAISSADLVAIEGTVKKLRSDMATALKRGDIDGRVANLEASVANFQDALKRSVKPSKHKRRGNHI